MPADVIQATDWNTVFTALFHFGTCAARRRPVRVAQTADALPVARNHIVERARYEYCH